MPVCGTFHSAAGRSNPSFTFLDQARPAHTLPLASLLHICWAHNANLSLVSPMPHFLIHGLRALYATSPWFPCMLFNRSAQSASPPCDRFSIVLRTPNERPSLLAVSAPLLWERCFGVLLRVPSVRNAGRLSQRTLAPSVCGWSRWGLRVHPKVHRRPYPTGPQLCGTGYRRPQRIQFNPQANLPGKPPRKPPRARRFRRVILPAL